MAEPPGPSVADWIGEARQHCRDASALARRRSWRNAYMLAGFATECALKACIMQRLRLNRWPARDERRELYSHDLAALADLSDMMAALRQAAAEGRRVGLAWMVLKDFSINRRYPDGRDFPVRLGRDMVEAACGDDGLVEWLIKATMSMR